jgi:uncharacterized protein (DUF983 family)
MHLENDFAAHRRNVSAAAGIVRQLCPRCRWGKIFSRSIFLFPRMHERCPICDLKFARESGYFLGAMYISYGLGLVLILALTVALLWFARWSYEKSIVVAMLLFLPFAPLLTHMARVLWIYLDQAIDPEKNSS